MPTFLTKVTKAKSLEEFSTLLQKDMNNGWRNFYQETQPTVVPAKLFWQKPTYQMVQVKIIQDEPVPATGESAKSEDKPAV